MGNRGFFRESGVVDLAAGPDPAVPTHTDFCRPFHADGELVALVRRQLDTRAQALGWVLREAPLGGLHLMDADVRVQSQSRRMPTAGRMSA